MLHRVAVLYNPHRPRAITEAEWLAGELRARGVEPLVGNGWDPTIVRDLSAVSDLAVALGGDGTIIHIARIIAPLGVPMLGINLGRVGFLAEMTPDALHEHVDDLAAGTFWIEQRTMLEAHCAGDGTVQQFLALNEVVMARGLAPHAIRIALALDGDRFTTYTADGVIVATATGSTAYSLAAGGPIVYPESRDIVITPVAPHLHIGRSTIVPGDVVITLTLATDRQAVMSVDGSDEHEVKPNHTVTVRRSEMVARFARLGPCSYFYSAIADRL